MPLDDELTVPDWLGRPQPLARKALELTTSGGGGVTAPVTPSVGQRTAAVSRAFGGSPTSPRPGSTTSQEILSGLGLAKSSAELISRFFPTGTPPPSAVPAELGGTGEPVGLGVAAGGEAQAPLAETLAAGGQVVPYLGAALSFARDLMAEMPDEQKALNAAVDVASAALIPATGGLSVVAAPLAKAEIARTLPDIEQGNVARLALLDLNPAALPLTLGADVISMFGGPDILGGLFGGGPSRYAQTRGRAIGEATQALGTLAGTYAGVSDVPSALKALQTTEGGRGAVRSSLVLPPNAVPGLSGPVEWSALNLAQFTQVLDYFRTNPEALATAIQGSGDIGYLPQAQAQQVADNAAAQARALIDALIQATPAAPASTGAAAGTTPLTPEGPSRALGFATDLLPPA